MEELMLRSLADFGVPTVVCFFLLFKGAKSMDALTLAITELVQANGRIENTIKSIDHDVKAIELDVKDLERSINKDFRKG